MTTKDIRFFLVFLIIVLAYLAWSQSENFGPIPNQGSLSRNNVQLNANQSIPLSNQSVQSKNLEPRIDPRVQFINTLKKKEDADQ